MKSCNDLCKRKTGAYYTCAPIADYISKWAIQSQTATVLEPSFGDGSFLNAIFSRFNDLGNQRPEVTGVEIQDAPFAAYLDTKPFMNGIRTDFMEFRPNTKFDAVLGNPPYIRLRHLEEKAKMNTISLMNDYHVSVAESASLWMPFVIHSTELLKKGGRLGFVLPYEITYVRYAFPLWKYLKEKYGELCVYRIHYDFFPEVDVETIVFLACERGGKTDIIKYKIFKSIEELFNNNPDKTSNILIDDIFTLDKPFEMKLLPSIVTTTIERLKFRGLLRNILEDCKFNIGYVCGNKTFFHPTNEIVKQFHISSQNLLPCIINTKQINNDTYIGLDTLMAESNTFLFYPTTFASGDNEYISYGEKIGINTGYKCRTRKPWYITPGVVAPDLILTVFGDVPRLIANSACFKVSNSLLGGFISSQRTAKEIVCNWYNSLTLLLIELYVHSLGGGSLVLIPGEIDKMNLLVGIPKSEAEKVYNHLNECMLSEGVLKTYLLGDELVLKQIYHLSKEEVEGIRDAVRLLQSWRKPDKRRKGRQPLLNL